MSDAVDHSPELNPTLLRYHLSESDVTQLVSYVHLQEICRSLSLKWRLLPAHLMMKNPATIVHDVERSNKPEDEMRADFLSRWQREKGTDANYKSLINALLVIGCRQDAEYVCELLNKETRRESAGCNGELSGELVKVNFSRIKGCFGTLVDNVAMKLSSLNISINRFRTFVANLFPPGDVLSSATSILEIFQALTHTRLWDHSCYSAFESIYKKFGEGDAELKMWIDNYKAELAGFKATTKIIEYMEMCDSLNDFADSEQSISQYKACYDKNYYHRLAIKTKRKITEKSLEYIDEVWSSVSELFLLPPLPALLENIRSGCTEITWLISAQAGSQIKSATLDRSSIELLQQLEVMRVTINGRILYEKEPDTITILEQELRANERQIKMLMDAVHLRDSIIKRSHSQIIQLQVELDEVKEATGLSAEFKLKATEEQKVSPLDLQLKWDHGSDISFSDMGGYIQSVVVQDKVYFGGEVDYVLQYDTMLREWEKIFTQYKAFAMVEISSHLVIIGGLSHQGESSKMLHMLSANSKEWTYPYPEMPIGRYDCFAIVYGEWLVVGGGNTDDILVAVMNTESKQWFTGPSLPQPWWWGLNTAIVEDTCYFFGDALNYSVSIPTLINIAIISESQTAAEEEIWKEITAPPNHGSFPLSFNGSLYAIGGGSNYQSATTSIHLYQPDLEEWVKVGDLLSPRSYCACAMITNREMLVVGGYDERESLQNRTDIAIL